MVLQALTAAVFAFMTFATRAVTALSLRQRLLKGSKAYGPILLSDSPIVAEVLATVGYDFLILDQEHSVANPSSTQHMIRAIQSMQVHMPSLSSQEVKNPPSIIVRLPSPQSAVQHTLDSGASGILVPMVESALIAQEIVQRVRFPPAGHRGCAVPFIRSSGYGALNYTDYQRVGNDVMVMVQVETPAGIEAIPEIAAVDGVDGIFLGPLDISSSLGEMGDFESAKFRQTMERAEDLIRQQGGASNCWLAGFRVPGRTAQQMFDQGYSLVCSAIDLGLLKRAAIADAEEGRDAIEHLECKT